MSILDDHWARSKARHAASVERGEHDHLCEWGERLVQSRWANEPQVVRMHMCHCAMRRRVASGLTEVPTLVFPEPVPPSCSHCDEETELDGDAWICTQCSVTWSYDGSGGMFHDEYGDMGAPVKTVSSAGGVL